MATPTFPALWADLLTQLNTVLNWDIVKGAMVITLGIFIAAIAMSMVSRALRQ